LTIDNSYVFAVYSEKKSIFKDFFIWRKRSRKDRIERERGGGVISDNVVIGVNCLCGKKKLIEKMQNI